MDKLEALFAAQAAFNASINKTRHLEDVTDDEWGVGVIQVDYLGLDVTIF